jgi:hypothetical protein
MVDVDVRHDGHGRNNNNHDGHGRNNNNNNSNKAVVDVMAVEVMTVVLGKETTQQG